jgi:hypothetical protein
MLAIFSKGSHSRRNTINGGFSFNAPTPQNVNLTVVKVVTLEYSLSFERGFQFDMAGSFLASVSVLPLVSSS